MNDPIMAKYSKRFHEKIEKKEDGCWIYREGKSKKGYGVFQNPYNKLAHRFSWILHNGPIPKGLFVCHTCDVPACTQPLHLFLGTNEDNMKDMVKKNRPRGARIKPKGDKHASSKITEQQALDIIRLLEEGKNYKDIALQFNIKRNIVSHIKCGDSWRHLTINSSTIGPSHKKLPLKKLTLQEVTEIRELYKNKVSVYKIASIFNVSISSVYKIKQNKRWIQ